MKIIVSPLDWGLGHATRCVAIIKAWLAKGADVEIASAACHKDFFSQEFPNLLWHEAPAYDIRYPAHGILMPLWALRQLPHLKKVMKEENKWLANLVERRKPEQIISDNRFGFFNPKVKSTYITHQLRIAFPKPFIIFEKLGENWHRSIMRNFDEILVPDYPEFPGLAGKLSHPSYTDKKIKYIGPISRLHSIPLLGEQPKAERASSKTIDILALLSGPEPQRSVFEQEAVKRLLVTPGEHCLVRGLPGESEVPNLPFPVFNHLSAEDLREKILASRTVLCRSGYSTVMDLHLLKANAIFVPTPGQTEQEYLAELAASQNFLPYPHE
ncbi:MAG: hypothetical protein LBC85_09700 [Fibromonadaceae bacterium]|jgi:hypothetical protein|nr:hypothetical protein [Fibromonadaceae bacterium]